MKKLAAVFILMASSAVGADAEWVRQWESAQKSRPKNIASVGRIAAAGEPGIPLIVHGRVLQSDGVMPAPGVIVFAYQTDADGVYNRAGQRGWRLKGWARSDANGRFELRTIRPGSYPRSQIPAHIHVTIDAPSVPRRWMREIEFADDPHVQDQRKAFPVVVRNGVQHVEYVIRIGAEGTF